LRPSRTRVVLDTNVLVSGILFEGSEAKILRSAEEGRIVVFLSLEILEEFVDVLSREKFQLSAQEVLTATEYILSFVKIKEPAGAVKIGIRDPEDLKFLACAKRSRAHFLVTRDKDLLAVRTFDGTQILTPAKFLSLTSDSSRG